MMASWLQDPSLVAATLTTWLPFVSFLLIIVFTRNHRRLSGGISLAAVTGSLAGAVFLLVRHWGMDKPIHYAARWLIAGDVHIPFGFLLDPVSLLMLTLVAAISFLVQVYSLGYMAGDPGFSRYYAFQSLFAWAMMTLTISSAMLQLYVFWELVGLSSYLLIGFWYERFSATQAGKKAFVMTRLGDVSFFIGLLLVLLHLGNLEILEMNSPEVAARMPSGLLTLAALLIFGGIVGKSAQFPLMTWLPDAMEGPTPVSALLHSATMVAAGVYLFARLFPFLSHSADAMTVFLAIGTVSMLLASTMAMVSRDIKQVWAYSTISQLGFMIMGLAAGSLFAGTFHLTTHAGFKALLFLCSGVWVHLYETNDVYEISRRGGRATEDPYGVSGHRRSGPVRAAAPVGLLQQRGHPRSAGRPEEPPLAGSRSARCLSDRLLCLSAGFHHSLPAGRGWRRARVLIGRREWALSTGPWVVPSSSWPV